ncbi:hypothetical protein BCR35DRAFT_334733 [Leucosporidium creatinivorum]|uniref:F-box domain-containing protein n=1 Tax=Leucosporidium creatinivorum TaxID=106004 RepID=A0A1Y2DX65_9BASI|nr:hypothetical protein BCR35DRAFT_334733 [Leucosporidium creatinivorum]
MHSKDSKLKQGSREMKQVTPSSLEALPSAFSSLSLDIPKPKTFNDLPDELLDDIASHLASSDPEDLVNLSLVEQRLYEPARRAMIWKASGLTSIMAFADLLLSRPELGRLVRGLRLEGRATTEPEDESPLVGRAMACVLEECPGMVELDIAGIKAETLSEREVLSSVGRLRQLQELHFDEKGVSLTGLGLFGPALSSCSSLRLTLADVEDCDTSALPSFPACAIRQLELQFNNQPLDFIQVVLSFLASATTRLQITIWHLPPLSFAELDEFLPSYIENASSFSLLILSKSLPDSWKALRLPEHAGWLYHTSTAYLGPLGSRPPNASDWTVHPAQLRVGRWDDVGQGMDEDIQGWIQSGRSILPTTVWAKRGRDWTASDVAALERLAGFICAKVVWM